MENNRGREDKREKEEQTRKLITELKIARFQLTEDKAKIEDLIKQLYEELIVLKKQLSFREQAMCAYARRARTLTNEVGNEETLMRFKKSGKNVLNASPEPMIQKKIQRIHSASAIRPNTKFVAPARPPSASTYTKSQNSIDSKLQDALNESFSKQFLLTSPLSVQAVRTNAFTMAKLNSLNSEKASVQFNADESSPLSKTEGVFSFALILHFRRKQKFEFF